MRYRISSFSLSASSFMTLCLQCPNNKCGNPENISSRRSTPKAIVNTFFDQSSNAVSANPQCIEWYLQRSSQFLPARFIHGFFSLMIFGDEMEAFGRELLQAPIEAFNQTLFFPLLRFAQQ